MATPTPSSTPPTPPAQEITQPSSAVGLTPTGAPLAIIDGYTPGDRLSPFDVDPAARYEQAPRLNDEMRSNWAHMRYQLNVVYCRGPIHSDKWESAFWIVTIEQTKPARSGDGSAIAAGPYSLILSDNPVRADRLARLAYYTSQGSRVGPYMIEERVTRAGMNPYVDLVPWRPEEPQAPNGATRQSK